MSTAQALAYSNVSSISSIQQTNFKIVLKDTTNLWDQLRQIMRVQKYTTQDYASIALMEEFENVHPFFVVREEDNLLIGALLMIETEEVIYGNVYVVRDGFRASGFGVKMVFAMLNKLNPVLEKKPIIGRAVKTVLKVYQGPPFHAKYLYDMFIHEFANKEELRHFFGLTSTDQISFVMDLKAMNDKQFEEVIKYDRLVTGVNRRRFLKGYFSIDFVAGVALLSSSGEVIGLAGAVPTFEEGLFKIAPIFGRTPEEASILVNAICDKIDHPKAHFVFHRRTGSAGDWCERRSRDLGTSTKHVSIMLQSSLHNVSYTERCRSELIFAPTNSPAHFDA